MKTWKSLIILLALTACKGGNDNDSKATSNSTGTLMFDGRSAYRLDFRGVEKDNLVLSFVQQDEVRTMDLDRLNNDGTATDLSETDYFPRFIVQVRSGNLECLSGPIPFSDSMQLECKDSSNATDDDRTAGGANTPSSNISSCATGNSPSTLSGAKYDIDKKDGELRLVFGSPLGNDLNPSMKSPWKKFDTDEKASIYGENFVINGSLKQGNLEVKKLANEYEVFIVDKETGTEYTVGKFTNGGTDFISGTGNDPSYYKVNFHSNVCMAKFKNAAGSYSGGNAYLVIAK